MATPVCPAKNISPTYSPEIHGWDFSWLELLVAMLPLLPVTLVVVPIMCFQLKFQPCISGEYVGLLFFVIGVVGV